uniref:GAGE domain-containing protein n=1 Tax=Theropithecus gelada TaxID=9565 RepID=A0A8D2E2B6_THEGE
MSWRGRSTYRRRPRCYVEPPEMIGPMLVNCPTQMVLRRNPTTGKKDDCPALTAPEAGQSTHGPEPEADSQEQVHPKTGCERGDGPDVQEMGLPNPEEVKMTEERRQSIRHENCKVSVSTVSYYNYYYIF